MKSVPGMPEDAPARTFVSTLERPEVNETLTVPPNQSAMIRMRFGLGVHVVEHTDGRVGIAVDPHPLGASDRTCKALREFMEGTAVTWLRQVAPHRLADSFQSGY